MDIFSFAFFFIWVLILNAKISNLNKKIDNMIFNNTHGLNPDSEVLK